MLFQSALRAAAFGIAAVSFGSIAAADQLAEIKAAGKIVTATDMHYAPFDMLNNGTYEGITKDIFDEVAKHLGVEPVYQDIPWTAELPGLEVGKFDIVIAPVTITAERQERYSFTLPIAEATASLAKIINNADLSKPDDIKGKRVGVQQATAPAKQLDLFSQKIGDVTIKEYGTSSEAYADLAAGRLDAVAGSLPNLTYLVKARPENFALFDQPQFGAPTFSSWVLRKEEASETLVQTINEAVLQMHEDGRLQAIYEKWMGRFPDLPREMPTH